MGFPLNFCLSSAKPLTVPHLRNDASGDAAGTLGLQCVEGHTGPMCSQCEELYSRSGTEGPCYKCNDGENEMIIPWIVFSCGCIALSIALWKYISGAANTTQEVQCVMSFGSRNGGFDFAVGVKKSIQKRMDWPAHRLVAIKTHVV